MNDLTTHRLNELEEQAKGMAAMSKDNHDRLIRLEGKLDHVSAQVSTLTRGLWVVYGALVTVTLTLILKFMFNV